MYTATGALGTTYSVSTSTMPISVFLGIVSALIIPILIVAAIMIISLWIIFRKAGRKGWECIIPFYNLYVMLLIVGLPGWWVFVWIVVAIIPVIGGVCNFAFGIYLAYRLAQRFGKGVGFTLGMIFLPFIFYPI